MIESNSVIRLTYTLRTEKDGPVVETTDEKNPLVFISGQKQTLPLFEANILMKGEGDEYSFRIVAENAYGERNEDMVVELDKSIFGGLEEGALAVGNDIPMADSMGRKLIGRVMSLDGEKVKMDFNHPLAGKDLYFTGKILEVRDATEEELAALKKHSCGGCSGGCHDGGCGGGDCGCSSGCCGE